MGLRDFRNIVEQMWIIIGVILRYRRTKVEQLLEHYRICVYCGQGAYLGNVGARRLI